TGRNEAYYTDYLGKPQEFVSAVKWGYLYQGQRYGWQKKRRGTPATDLAPAQFVVYTQNHDQIANSGWGLRCHLLTSPGRFRAMTALMLLAPGTPMLFQGQRSEEHTSELQSHLNLVCRLLLEKKNKIRMLNDAYHRRKTYI